MPSPSEEMTILQMPSTSSQMPLPGTSEHSLRVECYQAYLQEREQTLNDLNALDAKNNLDQFFQDWKKERDAWLQYVQEPQSFLNVKPEYAILDGQALSGLHREYLKKLENLPIVYFAQSLRPLTTLDRCQLFHRYLHMADKFVTHSQLERITQTFQADMEASLQEENLGFWQED